MNRREMRIVAAVVALLLTAGCGPAGTPAPTGPKPPVGQQVRHPELVQPIEEALIALRQMSAAGAAKDLETAHTHFDSFRSRWEQIRATLRAANPGLEQHIQDGGVEVGAEFAKPKDEVRWYEFNEEAVKLGRLLAGGAQLLGVPIKPELVPKDASADVPFNQEQTVSIDLSEHKFTPAALEFNQHTRVTFVLTNRGKEVHAFELGHYGVGVEQIAPGKTEQVSIVLLDAGEFEFACHVPGHYEVGMSGTVKVKPAALQKGEGH